MGGCRFLTDGMFYWVSKPFPGAVHDMRVFREAGLLNLLPSAERLIGDKGYQGHPKIITPIKGRYPSKDEREFNTMIGEWRIVVEHSFGKLKRFHCLTQPWRGSLEKQGIVFRLCCHITNLKIRGLSVDEEWEADDSEEEGTKGTEGEL